jgi:hypothetical protein
MYQKHLMLGHTIGFALAGVNLDYKAGLFYDLLRLDNDLFVRSIFQRISI